MYWEREWYVQVMRPLNKKTGSVFPYSGSGMSKIVQTPIVETAPDSWYAKDIVEWQRS